MTEKTPYINSSQEGSSIRDAETQGLTRISRAATSAITYTEETVATGNFDKSRSNIDMYVIHTSVCCAQPAIDRFANPNSQVSAHYMVKLDGSLLHFLEEYYTAYHAGNYDVNQRSIGVEHEDCGDYNGVRPDSLYQTAIELGIDVVKYYSIPLDRQHIVKHSEVSLLGTACPDALDVDRIFNGIRNGINPPVNDLKVQVHDIIWGNKSVYKKIADLKKIVPK